MNLYKLNINGFLNHFTTLVLVALLNGSFAFARILVFLKNEYLSM